jgi:hypothetical protein
MAVAGLASSKANRHLTAGSRGRRIQIWYSISIATSYGTRRRHSAQFRSDGRHAQHNGVRRLPKPLAYLAQDLAYELERDLPVRLEWLPHMLDIPSFLGWARADADGSALEESRNARYSCMECRRQAHKRGLVIREPQKIWNSTLVAARMLYAPCR